VIGPALVWHPSNPASAFAARDTQQTLRGVKGEMIIVESDEIELSRPVRLIHPRWPLYVIPREDNRFMLGATSIESEDNGVSVRSALAPRTSSDRRRR